MHRRSERSAATPARLRRLRRTAPRARRPAAAGRRLPLLLLPLLAALLPARPAAANDWSLCPAVPLPAPPPAELAAPSLEADSATVREDGVSVLEGGALVRLPGLEVRSERIEYHLEEGFAETAAPGTLRARDLYLEGERLRAHFDSGLMVAEEAEFFYPPAHGRGAAARIEYDGRTTALESASYTTCPPGSNVWRMKAASLELDDETGVGTARHARLEVHGVPVLYTPWISFPWKGQRRTGFLAPIYRTSRSLGDELSLPFYLNLAPNYDAVLQPHFTQNQGELLGARFRYLGARGRGNVRAEAQASDPDGGGTRGAFLLNHRQRLARGLNAGLTYRRASDADYFRDLGSRLGVGRNANHLRSVGTLDYRLARWSFGARVEHFQIIQREDDPVDRRPYREAPRLTAASRFPERNRRLNFGISGSFTRFEHDTRPERRGERIGLRPSVSFPIRAPRGFLVSRATLRHGSNHFENNSTSHTIPELSIDGGLAFDRTFELREGRRAVQSLEPRLFYLWVPYEEQDSVPLVDSGALTPGFDLLFRRQRYTGTDRVGDENRLALGVVNRLLVDGREVLEARLGGTRHFLERRIRLSEGESASRSAWAADARVRPSPRVTLGGATAQEGGDSESRRTSLDLRYRPASGRVLNLGYHSVPDVAEAVSLSFHRDLPKGLRIFGNASRDIAVDRITGIAAGLEYESCCWRLRAVVQRYDLNEDRYDESLFLQIGIKGLTGGGLGRDIENRLDQIPGFGNRFY